MATHPTGSVLHRRSAILLVGFVACHPGDSPSATPSDALLGGDGTIFDDGAEALSYPARNLSQTHRGPFQLGDGIFNRNWVAAPASPQGRDGLGPTYNAISCSACHDHRGSPPKHDGQRFVGLLLRLSIPGNDEHGGPLPETNYGDQLQPYGVLKVQGEGTPSVSYREVPGTYADGQPFSRRHPTYSMGALAFGPLDARVMVSPRLAPQTVGLGLLQAVDETTIVSLAARNGGKPNRVWDASKRMMALGRFGWKAGQPTLEQQAAAAFRNDIGITNELYPTENCPDIQSACAHAPHAASQPELEALRDHAVVVHTYGLAVPARRNLDDRAVKAGERLFGAAGCAACHVPQLTTGSLAEWPELSNQTIHPYTDVLLHDMGPELADGRPEFSATGSEWRTPPLWSLGLVETIDGELFLMHDGRARGFAEAILWHGGQAEPAREAFRAMSKSDRDAMIAFLSSL